MITKDPRCGFRAHVESFAELREHLDSQHAEFTTEGDTVREQFENMWFVHVADHDSHEGLTEQHDHVLLEEDPM